MRISCADCPAYAHSTFLRSEAPASCVRLLGTAEPRGFGKPPQGSGRQLDAIARGISQIQRIAPLRPAHLRLNGYSGGAKVRLPPLDVPLGKAEREMARTVSPMRHHRRPASRNG